jgi:hypothetical protein
MILTGRFTDWWAYLIAPVIGGALAVQAAVVELIERWARGGANRLRWTGRRRRALLEERAWGQARRR